MQVLLVLLELRDGLRGSRFSCRAVLIDIVAGANVLVVILFLMIETVLDWVLDPMVLFGLFLMPFLGL